MTTAMAEILMVAFLISLNQNKTITNTIKGRILPRRARPSNKKSPNILKKGIVNTKNPVFIR
jgi:hypothetical protein